MRIIAGAYKGRTLKTLKGQDTRPTTMRVKESLFSSLNSLLGSFEGLEVLDAFAGSGALGIEALSRGASTVVFFERSRKAGAIVSDNLKLIGVGSDRAILEFGDAARLISRKRSNSFDLVFLDPPYSMDPEMVFVLIDTLEQSGSLNADAIICYELAKKNEPEAELCAHRLKWHIVSKKNFGETAYCIIRKESR